MANELLLSLREKVDPRHAAMVVVDMQNDFCAEGGFFHQTGQDLSLIQPMVPNLVQFIEHGRRVGLPIVFIQAIYDDIYLSAPMRERNRRKGWERPRLVTGSWGADFYLVKPHQRDLVVIKHRYSSFAGTELDILLRNLAVKSLIMTGVATNVCVESTARDGYFLNYYIVLVEDCCATTSQSLHRATLANIDENFGVVCTAPEVVDAWDSAEPAGGSATVGS